MLVVRTRRAEAVPDPILVFDDLEMFLCSWFRAALAARPEPVCQNVAVDRVEPNGDASTWPDMVLVIRDDGTTDDDLHMGDASVGFTVLGGSRENPHDAKLFARIVYGLIATIPSGDPDNPVAAVGTRNGPFLVPEDQPRARVYTTATLRVAARLT